MFIVFQNSFLIFLLGYFSILILVHKLLVDLFWVKITWHYILLSSFYLGQFGALFGLEGKGEIVF